MSKQNNQDNSNIIEHPALPNDLSKIPEVPLHYPDQVSYLRCARCQRHKECGYFSKKYKILKKQAKDEGLIETKEIDEKLYYSYLDKANNKEVVEDIIKERFKELLEECNDICVYEINMASNMFNDFETSYKVTQEPTLKYLVYTIISQAIIQMRLQKTISMTDILKTKVIIVKDKPVEIEIVTPVLSYKIKQDEELTKSLIKFREATAGIKVKLEGELTVKDLMHKIISLPLDKDK